MRILRLLAILLAVPLLMAAGAPPKLQSFEKGEITVISANGPHKFKVEIAASDGQREQGLMFRQQMAADAGMIFIWQQPQPIVMWMENTYIPLDMLFVDENGVILNIRERAVPFSREQIPSAGPAKVAIELNGGTAAKLGIKAGDKVTGAGF
ncbi:MAG TPA: DUF192 domain-containing protein [Aliidongia sp.]|nr:DUF192 domain-containing protein [Aliidongia sp.]